MQKQLIFRLFLILVLTGLVGGMVLAPVKNEPPVLGNAQSAHAAEPAMNIVFMPLTLNYSPTNTIFGLEMVKIDGDNGLNLAVEASPSWVRRNALFWSDVEPNEGTYEWGNLASLEQELINASENGLEVILIVRSTPPWAQALNGYYCGRIRTDKLVAFGNFLYEAVKRYSVAPFNVKYWQIWNEPDVDPAHPAIEKDNIYGCWGEETDPYYGGGYYGEVLKVVFPRIKEANPAVQVLVGGLLMACNVELPAVCSSPQTSYLEGILRRNGNNDGGNYFDIVAYHSYDYYYDYLGGYGNSSWGTRWADEGPVVAAKARYIRNILSKYGLGEKPLMSTEVAILCGSTGNEPKCQESTFQNTKAYYLAQNYASALAVGLKANVWYSLSASWRGSALLDAGMNQLPAYTAYRVAREKLHYSHLARVITEYSGVNGYDFEHSNGHVWVLWSKAADSNGRPTSVQVNLPGTPVAIWDVFGNPVSLSGNSLTLSSMPLYVEWE